MLGLLRYGSLGAGRREYSGQKLGLDALLVAAACCHAVIMRGVAGCKHWSRVGGCHLHGQEI
jgi:hypothetical protein